MLAEAFLAVAITISGAAQDIAISVESEAEKSKHEVVQVHEAYTVLTPELGLVQGPWCIETYYNLNMEGVLEIMYSLDYYYDYWVREDGVKMFGDYVMVAANLDIFPRGSIVETSLGQGIVCDTGEFIYDNPYQFDIAVDW